MTDIAPDVLLPGNAFSAKQGPLHIGFRTQLVLGVGWYPGGNPDDGFSAFAPFVTTIGALRRCGWGRDVEEMQDRGRHPVPWIEAEMNAFPDPKAQGFPSAFLRLPIEPRPTFGG
ncbi:hypothetical protein SAMN00790413_00878 [Deinococcus hopiensis KR-140]|uniref:Uncharacterized protein n=1 Tax=Deinococcus hopiensis KR-140 TaxID=695939 RepID=A0A1W1VCN8_9DEIO|nr:hypothetical protein SAMN00790413_00878 [Deinococcus hopiensis KR-140]